MGIFETLPSECHRRVHIRSTPPSETCAGVDVGTSGPRSLVNVRGIDAGTHAGPVARQPTFLKRARRGFGYARFTKSGRPPCATREPACQSRTTSVTGRRRGHVRSTARCGQPAASVRKSNCRRSDRRRHRFATDVRTTRTPNRSSQRVRTTPAEAAIVRHAPKVRFSRRQAEARWT